MLLTPDQRRMATHGQADNNDYDPLLAQFEAAAQEAIEGYSEQLLAVTTDVVIYCFDAPPREIRDLPPLADAAPVVTLAGAPLTLNTDYQLLTLDPRMPYARTRLYPHWRGIRRLIDGLPAAWTTGLSGSAYGALTIASPAWRWDEAVPARGQVAATAILRQLWDRHQAGWGTHAGGGDSLTDTVRTLLPATVADLLTDYKEAAHVHL